MMARSQDSGILIMKRTGSVQLIWSPVCGGVQVSISPLRGVDESPTKFFPRED